MKPTLHKHLEQSREAQIPKKGDRVEFPVPFPPVSHVTKGKKTHEVAVPVGHEEWFPATVVEVEHLRYSVAADDYMAHIQPDDGPPRSMSAVFLRPTSRPR